MQTKYSNKSDCINAIPHIGHGSTVILNDPAIKGSGANVVIYKPLGQVVNYSEADHYYLVRGDISPTGEEYYTATEILGNNLSELIANIRKWEDTLSKTRETQKKIDEIKSTLREYRRRHLFLKVAGVAAVLAIIASFAGIIYWVH